ncbi:MAG: VCBS repeat-containing protein, partial [Gammaproteobacteria bacterium]|nr:VCBS repeat-containing protein [Gammaproteobacteria bacterium]
FCTYGGSYVLEWRSGELALSDAVASWLPNRYNQLVPRHGNPRALAVSRDGRHAYVSTPEGILVFDRVNNVGDDHGDSREAATAADGLPWSGTGELNWKGDRDVFRIRFDRPGALTVYTTGDTDTFGMLTDANGAVLEQDDDGEAPNFEIRATVDAGVYYVEVRGADDETTGPYTLWIEFVPDPPEVAFTPERPIATDLHEADSVHAADLDGDGDPDVLAASSHDATIAWYENVGGGAFSPQRVLTADAEGAASVHATDLDGDGDADVLSAAREDDRIAWHENLGGGRFSEQRVTAYHADGAASVHAADLDGDGDADVLTASSLDDTIAWHENLGGGNFSSPRAIADTADGASDVRAADLDGDGDPDVLSAARNDGMVAWYENLGAGSFSARRILARNAAGVRSVRAADLDGDGSLDVLSASTGDGRIGWYRNVGGRFSSQRVVTRDAEARVVRTADLDGDRDADILYASTRDGHVGWHENLGGGVFSGQHAIATGVRDVGSLHTADLDGDGDPDVPFVSPHDDEVAWHENLSDHGDDHADAPAGATVVTALPAFLHGTVGSAGDRDVFRVATGAGRLRVQSNGPTDTHGILLDADGEPLAADHDAGAGLNFAIEIEVEAGPHYVAVTDDGNRGGIGPYTLSIEFVAAGVAPGTADDHGDDAETATAVEALPWSAAAALQAPGDRDVFRIDLATGGRLTVYTTGDTDTYGTLMDADGAVLAEDDDTGAGTNFEIEAAVRAGVHYVEVRGFAVETGRYTLTIEFVANPPGVAFGLQNVLTTFANGARAVHAADLDGDGDPDVLSASPHDDKIAWYENQGAGRFSTQQVIATDADGATWVHAADLDGDGDADVLSASDFDAKIAWYENLGGGNFSSQHPITLEAVGAVAVHAADLDGDGDADVLSASHRDDKVAWYENLGDGSFSAQRVIEDAVDGAYSVHAADLDGDGDADVVTAAFEGDRIAWHENLGGGRFSGRRDIATGVDGAASVHAADMDGDGDLDVLAASFEGNEVAWYENGGAGSFAARRAVAQAATSPWTVHPADFDGDRDPDVLAASGHGNGVALFENTGGGSLSAERMIATDARFARSVYAADLDGDGDADVLSASEYDSKIAWYENTADHGDDHGDAPGEATLASALPAFLHGVVESAGDRDVFRVATAGGALRVHSEGPTDTYGTVLDAAGAVLGQNDDGGPGANFELELEVAPGVHYVEVRGFFNSTGRYTLTIEFVAGAGGAP